MKVINANNIEKWMFDYFEGNLSLHEKIEIESFVRENPSYQTDFEIWSKAYVQEESLVYRNADALIKKRFFEDKKLLLFFSFLIGTGILLQNLTINDVESSLIASTNRNSIKSVNKNVTINAHLIDRDQDKDLETINELMFSDLFKSENTLIEKESTKLNNQNNFTLVSNYSFNTTATLAANIDSKLNRESVANNQLVTNEKGANELLNKRELESMFYYSENKIKSNFEDENIKKNSLDTELEIIEVADYKGGIVDYKKKNSFNHYKSKTLSKSLSRMLSKDLLLTVYNNRLTLKSNQIVLATNSAFAGNLSAPRLQLNYERLSLVSQNDFKFSFDNKINNLNAGVGLVLSNQNGFAFNKKQVELIYAHWFNVGGVKLTSALKGGVYQTEVNWSKIGVSGLTTKANDSINNDIDIGFNVAPSLMIKLPFAYAGLQINDAYSSTNKFVDNYQSFELQDKVSYSIMMGTDYRKKNGQKFVISPQLYIDIFNDDRKTKYTFATTMHYSNLLIGAGYTNNKTFRGVVGFDLKGFRMAYNAQFDIDLYNVDGADGIKHELAIQYVISKKKLGILLYD
jgi:hypothetical protein